MITTQEDFFIKIFTSHFIARVRTGLLKVCMWKGAGDRTKLKFLTPKLWPTALCLSRSPGLLNRSPGVHSAGCWLSFFPYHISSTSVSNSTQLSSSVQFVGLILPSNSHAVIWTRLHASAISSDIWRSGCVTSAIFGMACVIVIERK